VPATQPPVYVDLPLFWTLYLNEEVALVEFRNAATPVVLSSLPTALAYIVTVTFAFPSFLTEILEILPCVYHWQTTDVLAPFSVSIVALVPVAGEHVPKLTLFPSAVVIDAEPRIVTFTEPVAVVAYPVMDELPILFKTRNVPPKDTTIATNKKTAKDLLLKSPILKYTSHHKYDYPY
jgi:hypothetical protein